MLTSGKHMEKEPLERLVMKKWWQSSRNRLTSRTTLPDLPMCGLPIVKVGINFDEERRTIGDWEIIY